MFGNPSEQYNSHTSTPIDNCRSMPRTAGGMAKSTVTTPSTLWLGKWVGTKTKELQNQLAYMSLPSKALDAPELQNTQITLKSE